MSTTTQDPLPLPSNLEAERSVLGCLMLDPDALRDVGPMLEATDFLRSAHRAAYRAILERAGRGEAVDADALARVLGGDGEALAEAAAIAGSVPNAANARYFAEIVREKAVARRLIAASERTREECHSNRYTAAELIDQARRRIDAVDARPSGRAS